VFIGNRSSRFKQPPGCRVYHRSKSARVAEAQNVTLIEIPLPVTHITVAYATWIKKVLIQPSRFNRRAEGGLPHRRWRVPKVSLLRPGKAAIGPTAGGDNLT
jgi:hypothetical protein